MKIYYNQNLKSFSRELRHHQTDAENLLWSRIRRKLIKNTQFYRQRPIGNYIVDFYAPSAKLIIEIDGGQHFETGHEQRDQTRDNFMTLLNIKSLRFDNLQVLQQIDDVIEVIYKKIESRSQT